MFDNSFSWFLINMGISAFWLAGAVATHDYFVGLGALFFIGMALLLVLSTVRIKVTTRTQLVVGIVTVAVIVVVDLVTTIKGGSHGQALSAFSFGHTVSGGFNGVFYGIILGVTSYIGFETAADFGEETANPRRYIPIAIIAATGFAVVFYLWTTYAIAIGFGVKNGAAWGADPVALQTIANIYVAHWVGTLVLESVPPLVSVHSVS